MTTFEQLYDACHVGIGRHVGAMLHRYPAEVEDIEQKTWLKVFCALPDVRQEPCYWWVVRIATNTALDFLRSANRRAAVSLDGPVPGGYEGSCTWDDILEGAADVGESYARTEELHRVLRQLTPRYRRLLLLECAGFNQAEIAAREQMTPCSVKNSLPRAKQQARVVRAREEAYAS